jgi:hypothetical protein
MRYLRTFAVYEKAKEKSKISLQRGFYGILSLLNAYAGKKTLGKN